MYFNKEKTRTLVCTLKKAGYKNAMIGRKLGVSRATIIKYEAMGPAEPCTLREAVQAAAIAYEALLFFRQCDEVRERVSLCEQRREEFLERMRTIPVHPLGVNHEFISVEDKATTQGENIK